MDKEGQPLQIDMFTGSLVDNRTQAQKRLEKQATLPHQMTMFSLRDTVEIGVSARPWLNNLPRPPMELISEDPRTDEEKERDLLREAQELTSSMFGVPEAPNGSKNGGEEQPDTPVLAASEEQSTEALQEPVDELDEPEAAVNVPEIPKPAKEDAYAQLAQITKEYALTIWIDEAYRQKFYNQLPIAILEAQAVGLTPSEITTAMQEGDTAGKQEKADAVNTSPASAEQTIVVFPTANTGNGSSPQYTRVEGYRVRARRSHVRIRHPYRRVAGPQPTVAATSSEPGAALPHS